MLLPSGLAILVAFIHLATGSAAPERRRHRHFQVAKSDAHIEAAIEKRSVTKVADYQTHYLGEHRLNSVKFDDGPLIVPVPPSRNARRIRLIRVWCDQYVKQLDIVYESPDGLPVSAKHGENDALRGDLRVLHLQPDEHITAARADKCKVSGVYYICYLELLKGRRGSEDSSPADLLTCGHRNEHRKHRRISKVAVLTNQSTCERNCHIQCRSTRLCEVLAIFQWRLYPT